MTTRRQFIAASVLAAAIATGLPGCGSEADPMTVVDQGAVDALALGVTGFYSKHLGTLDPEPEVRRRLVTSLVAQGAKGAGLEPFVAKAIREDFAAGRTVDVRGWTLSVTEADLLALSAHLHQRDGTSPEASRTSAADAEESVIATVKAWGPTLGCSGAGFNVQSDGHSSLWIAFEGDMPGGLQILIGRQLVATTQGAGLLTARVEAADVDRLLGEGGVVPIGIYDPAQRRRQKVGDFTVTPAGEHAVLADGSRSTAFREVTNWGPRSTARGVAFNSSDGTRSALWITTACAPLGTKILFDGEPLVTTVAAGLVTASLSSLDRLERARTVQVALFDPASGETLPVGDFGITP